MNFKLVLVLQFFLHVLISQKHSLQLNSPLLLLLILASLNSLRKRRHLIILLMQHLLLTRLLLSIPRLRVLMHLPLLNLVALDLHIVSLSILLLLGEVELDLPQVEELSAGFEVVRDGFFELVAVVLQVGGVLLLEAFDHGDAVLLELVHAAVPVLVELVEFEDVGFFEFESVVLLSHVQLVF